MGANIECCGGKERKPTWSMAAEIGVLADLPIRCTDAQIMLGVGQLVKMAANTILCVKRGGE